MINNSKKFSKELVCVLLIELAHRLVIGPVIRLTFLGTITDSFTLCAITEFLELRFRLIHHMSVSSVDGARRFDLAASLAVFDSLVIVFGDIPTLILRFRELRISSDLH